MSHKRLFAVIICSIIVLSVIFSVGAASGHDDDYSTSEDGESTYIGISGYLFVILFVSIVVALGLYSLRYFESSPGTFPMRKLMIAATLTIVLNSILFGYIYRDVIF